MNHSCEANTIWDSDTQMSARVKIKKGEEVTFDYGSFNTYFEVLIEKCECGSNQCRGRVRGDDYKLESFRKLYGDKVVNYIRKKF